MPDSDDESGLSKRPRRPLLWRRLIDERTPIAPISVTEKIDEKVLTRAIQHMTRWGLEGVEEAEAMAVEMRQANPRTVVYRTLSYDTHNGGGYRGSTQIGRMFARDRRNKPVNSLQSVKRVVRNTVLGDDYHYLDMENAHPRIASQLFAHVGCPTLTDYVNRRDQWEQELQHLDDVNMDGEGSDGLPGDVIKRAVNSILNNAKAYTAGFVHAEREYGITISRCSRFRSLYGERDRILGEIKVLYPDLYSIVTAKKAQNPEGRAFSLLMQDVENAMLQCVIRELPTVEGIVLMFDGLIVPKASIGDDPVAFIRRAEARIKTDTGLEMRLHSKELYPRLDLESEAEEDDDQPETVNAGAAYDEWKREFEKTHYRLEHPICFVYSKAGIRGYHSLAKFKSEVCCEENQDYVKDWVSDPSKRRYLKEDFFPPPNITPADQLNLYEGLRAESLPELNPDDVEQLVGPIVEHVKVLTGGNSISKEYLLNWLALRVQKPGVLPLVALGFRSVQGTGKDSFFVTFFGKRILGDRYISQVPDIGTLFTDKHSNHILMKLLVVISEATRPTNSDATWNKLKGIITAPTVEHRPLYVESSQKANYAGFILFGQDQQFVKVEAGDRRWALFECLPVCANNAEYFNRLYAAFNDDRVARAFYQYLMQRDISDFVPSRDRPKTSTSMSMASFSTTPFHAFMKQWVHNEWRLLNSNFPITQDRSQMGACQRLVLTRTITRGELYDLFKEYVVDNFSKYADDVATRRKFRSECDAMDNDSQVLVGGKLKSIFRHHLRDGIWRVTVYMQELFASLESANPEHVEVVRDESLDIDG